MRKEVYLLAVLLGLSTASAAQVLTVKPGLWEHKVELKTESGQVEKALELARAQMALLPPAQRQMMEGMLNRQGLKFDLVNQSFRNCVSEAEAASGQFRFAEEGGCTLTTVRNVGPDTEVGFVCAQGQGEGELTLRNGSEYSGRSSMTLDFAGIVERASATHSGRWLSASCEAL